MALNRIEKETNSGTKEYLLIDSNEPENERLIFKVFKNENYFEYYPLENEFYLNKITFTGFNDISDDFGKYKLKHNVLYYLNNVLKKSDIKEVIVTNEFDSDEYGSLINNLLTLNYDYFKKLKNEFYQINQSAIKQRYSKIRLYLGQIIPVYLESISDVTYSSKSKVKDLLNLMDESIIPDFTKSDIKKLEDFSIKLIQNRYQNDSNKFEQIKRTKLKVDEVTIKNIIQKFEQNLEKQISESEWGKFLKKNLYLLDTNYIHIINELNVVLATARKVDFGMVDSFGFLDLYEI